MLIFSQPCGDRDAVSSSDPVCPEQRTDCPRAEMPSIVFWNEASGRRFDLYRLNRLLLKLSQLGPGERSLRRRTYLS